MDVSEFRSTWGGLTKGEIKYDNAAFRAPRFVTMWVGADASPRFIFSNLENSAE